MADPQTVAHEAHDIAKRLVSLDPIDYDSVINQYLESNATSTSRALVVQGASRIKKLTSLQADLAFESHLVGKPQYNPDEQVINFAFERTYYPPSVPEYLPFSDRVNVFLHKQRFRGTWDTELHFNSTAQDDGEKLLITKIGPTKRRNATFLENIAPWGLIRPMLSFLVIAVADLLGFFRRHPFPSEGPISIILAAIAESWAWLRGGPIDRKNYPWPVKRVQGLGESGDKLLFDAYDVAQTRVRQVSESSPVHQGQDLMSSAIGLAGASVDSAKNLIGHVFDTAGSLEQQGFQAISVVSESVYNLASSAEQRLEQEASSRGVPVKSYKDMAEKNINDVAKWFGLVTKRAEEQTEQTKSNIKAKKGQAKDKLRDAGKKYGFESSDQLNQVTTDTSFDDKAFAGTRTPLGGHNPNHPQAASYAQAAQPESTLAGFGQTPLGPAVEVEVVTVEEFTPVSEVGNAPAYQSY